MKTTHKKIFNGTSISLIVEEFEDHVSVDIRASRIDPTIAVEFTEWSQSILSKYDKDPRPFQFKHPFTGQVATVWGDEHEAIAIVKSKPVDLN
jgi:hypothetical protein